MLDRLERFIHVDPNDLEVLRRFSTCHKVGHDLCSWQSELCYLDGAGLWQFQSGFQSNALKSLSQKEFGPGNTWPEALTDKVVVAHTGFEPVISALRGRRPRPLDECAL